MATTIYKFQSDLKGLIALNNGLREAKRNLDALKKGTQEYAAASKSVGTMTQTLEKNTGAIKKTNGAVKSLNASGNKMVAIFKSASIAIVAAFAFRAIIGGITGVIKIFAKFEQQMDAVRAISGATDKEFKELTESAKELGATTVFTAIQVAELQEEFARLGFSTEEILAAQAATLDLAAATGENLSSAAAIAGSSLRAYGLEAEQIVRVTNVMGASFTGSALNLERFTQSMKFAAPVAKTAGFTIEETSAMLMQLADSGLHGSIAGNALKNIFLRLGDANSKLNKSIGHTVQGLPQLIDEMKKMRDASFGLTEATELLDKRSAPAFLVLLRNIDELELKMDILNRAEGDISRMAAIRLDNLAGDMTLLQSATEGLGLSIGDAFDHGLRKAIYGLTRWIQEMSQSEKFIRQVKGSVELLTMAIQFFIVRMAAMRLTMLVSGKSMITFTTLVKLVGRSFTSARAQVILFRTALTGIKAAIAATGIGLLVVGLGELVAWMGKGSDAADEHAFAMQRLHDSFTQEMAAVQELGIYTQERHDRLREMNSTYKDLIGNIDLEIASQKELKAINDVVEENALSGLGNQIVQQEELRDEAIKTAAALGGVALKNIQNAEAARDAGEETRRIMVMGAVGKVKMNTDTWNEYIEELIQKRKDIAAEQKGIVDDYKQHITDLEEQQKNEANARATDRGLDVNAEETFRMALRDTYLNKLEDFRQYNFKKQQIQEKDAQLELEELEFVRQMLEFHDQIQKEKKAGQEALAEKHEATLNRMFEGSSQRAQSHFNKMKGQFGKIGVMISEYRKYVTNLSKVLEKSGESFSKSALSGFRLNNTKDRLKELMNLQVKQINDSFEREIAAANQAEKFKMQKFEKEKKLIETNIKSIAQISKQASNDQIIADIKANRNKYEVLKNIDEAEWTKMITNKKANRAKLDEWLEQMFVEEANKAATNEQVLTEIKNYYENERLKIKIANDKKVADVATENQAQNLRNMDTDLAHLGKNQAAQYNIFRQRQEDEVAFMTAQLNAGQITQAQFDLAERQREESLTEFKRGQYQERLQAISSTYQQMAAMVMQVSANMAAQRIQELENDFTELEQHEDNKFRRRLEIMEAAGGDTEAAQEAHNDKMAALERKKDNEVREVKKKQFRLEKANNIAMALINGAQAIAKVTAQTGIGAIAAAPLTSALIAAQIATILSQKFVGAKGGIIPGGEQKFAEGGMVVGPSHAQGGVKFAVGGRVAELEGGEAVINKRSTAMFRPQLSAMNAAGGGVRFEKGGITPGTRNALDNAKGTWNAQDIAGLISSSINAQQVYVTEADITTTQSTVSITEGLSSVFK